jgi:hypothetical protein
VLSSETKSLVQFPLKECWWWGCIGLFIGAATVSYGFAGISQHPLYSAFILVLGTGVTLYSGGELYKLATRKLVHFSGRAVWPADGSLEFPEPPGSYELILRASIPWSEYHGTIEIIRPNDRIALITLPLASPIFASKNSEVSWNGRNDSDSNSKATLKFCLTPTRPEPKLSSGRVEKLEIKIFVRTRPE